jgi:CRISPR/Cas system CSM-associated protein Csm2 small subunit
VLTDLPNEFLTTLKDKMVPEPPRAIPLRERSNDWKDTSPFNDFDDALSNQMNLSELPKEYVNTNLPYNKTKQTPPPVDLPCEVAAETDPEIRGKWAEILQKATHSCPSTPAGVNAKVDALEKFYRSIEEADKPISTEVPAKAFEELKHATERINAITLTDLLANPELEKTDDMGDLLYDEFSKYVKKQVNQPLLNLTGLLDFSTEQKAVVILRKTLDTRLCSPEIRDAKLKAFSKFNRTISEGGNPAPVEVLVKAFEELNRDNERIDVLMGIEPETVSLREHVIAVDPPCDPENFEHWQKILRKVTHIHPRTPDGVNAKVSAFEKFYRSIEEADRPISTETLEKAFEELENDIYSIPC